MQLSQLLQVANEIKNLTQNDISCALALKEYNIARDLIAVKSLLIECEVNKLNEELIQILGKIRPALITKPFYWLKYKSNNCQMESLIKKREHLDRLMSGVARELAKESTPSSTSMQASLLGNSSNNQQGVSYDQVDSSYQQQRGGNGQDNTAALTNKHRKLRDKWRDVMSRLPLSELSSIDDNSSNHSSSYNSSSNNSTIPALTLYELSQNLRHHMIHHSSQSISLANLSLLNKQSGLLKTEANADDSNTTNNTPTSSPITLSVFKRSTNNWQLAESRSREEHPEGASYIDLQDLQRNRYLPARNMKHGVSVDDLNISSRSNFKQRSISNWQLAASRSREEYLEGAHYIDPEQLRKRNPYLSESEVRHGVSVDALDDMSKDDYDEQKLTRARSTWQVVGHPETSTTSGDDDEFWI